jgi:hypothetical protein
MDYWFEVKKVEKQIESCINQYNALDLRSKAQITVSLIETSKFSMNVGRVNRAWAFLLIARNYWKNVIK